MKIYVFGNPLVKEDSLPYRLLLKLKKEFPGVCFQTSDPNENFPPKEEKNLIILDTVKNLKEVRLFDFDNLKIPEKTPISPHDYDLLFHLLLLKKLKKINSLKIIGVPSVLKDKKNIRNEVRKIITSLL
jgi:Ni,Fe-hydrogenase maturation factor